TQKRRFFKTTLREAFKVQSGQMEASPQHWRIIVDTVFLDSIGIPILRLPSRPRDIRARWGEEGTCCGPMMGGRSGAKRDIKAPLSPTPYSEAMRPDDCSHSAGLEPLQTDLCRPLGRLQTHLPALRYALL